MIITKTTQYNPVVGTIEVEVRVGTQKEFNTINYEETVAAAYAWEDRVVNAFTNETVKYILEFRSKDTHDVNYATVVDMKTINGGIYPSYNEYVVIKEYS